MFAQLIHRLFTSKPTDDDELLRLIADVRRLGRRVETLEDELAAEKARRRSFEGRVYAWKGKEIDPEPPEKARDALPLNDPRLTKAEVKARLAASGALVARKPTTTN